MRAVNITAVLLAAAVSAAPARTDRIHCKKVSTANLSIQLDGGNVDKLGFGQNQEYLGVLNTTQNFDFFSCDSGYMNTKSYISSGAPQ